ncbi:predicted protein [Histoplasma mississippiense (nom. inval.)]|uniref:predicted protein n=1 Tax=Ajellomyces capsulatus (strain NAm1 / WU24) TaxID=2059318 RepID=UPI000157D63A|nr:predicted protein [Histoplasma mississippiense (nom. inval.)]EDN06551.1 predicted protein [Histoplasma mississippiense (nom. inval.)]
METVMPRGAAVTHSLAAEAWPLDSSPVRVGAQREAKTHFQTKLNVITWRHAAIAISRMHLSCGGFKREYEADDAAVDQQAGHGSWAADIYFSHAIHYDQISNFSS